MLDSDQMNNQVDDAVADLDTDDDPPAFTSGVDGQSLHVSVERTSISRDLCQPTIIKIHSL